MYNTFTIQVGQQYSAALTNGLNQLQQLNENLQSNVNYQQQNGPLQSQKLFQAQIASNQSLRASYNNLQQPPPPLPPTVQISMQPLIKPVQPIVRNQPIQPVAPIVYSFGQPDYSNRLLGTNTKNKKITWGKGDSLEFEDDDLTNILG